MSHRGMGGRRKIEVVKRGRYSREDEEEEDPQQEQEYYQLKEEDEPSGSSHYYRDRQGEEVIDVRPTRRRALRPSYQKNHPFFGPPLSRGSSELDEIVGIKSRPSHRVGNREKFDLVPTRQFLHLEAKEGYSGVPVNLIANFFPVRKRTDWCLHQYHVEFEPEENRSYVRKAMLDLHGDKIGGFVFVSDGSSLWSVKAIEDENLTLMACREEDEPVRLTLKYIRELEPGDVTYLQLYNIIIRKCLGMMELEEIGRHFYDKSAAKDLPQHRLQLWPGFVTSLRQREHKLMLCVEITHKVIRSDNVLSFMVGVRDRHDAGHFKKEICSELIGKVVITRYNRKTYKVDDIDWTKNPTSLFHVEGQQVSFHDYYTRRYHAEISDMGQPLLVSRAKRRDLHRGRTEPILLVPELCLMTGLTQDMRTNFTTMRALATHLHQRPDERCDNIGNFMDRMRKSSQIRAELRKWGLDIESQAVHFKGRLLPKDQIVLGGVKTGEEESVVPDDHADWTYAMKTQNMLSRIPISGWVVITPKRDEPNILEFIQTMKTVGKGQGMTIGQPLVLITLAQTRPQAYLTAIRDALDKFRSKVQIIFTVLPDAKLDLYAAIKKRCYIDYGIPSQCILGKNLMKRGGGVASGTMSIATKIVIQMNAKLGGQPWGAHNPLKNSKVMVVGFDVYHCRRQKGFSIGAMVCTVNEKLSRYFSCVSEHHNREELCDNMGSMIIKCVTAFQKVNENKPPDRIIMYRDGVAEGQLEYVHNIELEQIKNALLGYYNNFGTPIPRLTVIVVSKRMNVRIFSDADVPRNPRPGTIVDDVITLPERWDFFLISQAVNQGTVAPISYNVIFDQQGLDADKIQRFTYKLTHLYFNWSGTLAIPAPVQYAHKLAYLTGLVLGGTASEKLSYLLYYL